MQAAEWARQLASAQALRVAALSTMFVCSIWQPAAGQTPAFSELDRRAMQVIATCAAVGRQMSPDQRQKLVPGQVERLRMALADARSKAEPPKQPGPVTAVKGPGAEQAPEGWFKETVAIYRNRSTDDKAFCSGVLVASNAVLTAGHCACDLDLGPPPQRAGTPVVRFGADVEHREKSNRGVERPVLTARTQLLDPNLCKARSTLGDAAFGGNDAAIVFFDPKPASSNSSNDPRNKPLKIEPGKPDISRDPGLITPARIATTSLLFSHSLIGMTAVGYGYNDKFQNRRIKTMGCLNIRSRICGFPGDQQQFGCASGAEVVLQDPAARTDTCFGDSGGPVFAVVDTGKDITYYLAAITSRAVDRRTGTCGPGGVYTLITPRIVEWMRAKDVSIPFYDFAEQ